ncbi:MAG: MATE family efflux transporter [Lachnospiraceae bacterium]|nr:MATE family efflux transporter [Lachnospiraceae bacterium]
MVNDMTTGNPLKAMTLFAIPLFIGTLFQQIYNTVDALVVGNFVGTVELGAVGSCASTFNLIIALLVGLTGGTSVIMAQAFGAKEEELVRKTFISSTIVNLLVGVILTVVGILVSHPLLLLLNTPKKQLGFATTYLTVMCAGILANCLYNGMSAVLRALGDSITPLVVLIAASLLNVVLDLLFVIVFHWGVSGVALATVLAQLISAVACIIYVLIRMPNLRFGLRECRLDPMVVKEIFRIGVPSALSSCGVSISAMFMQRAINGFGDVAVTGYTIGNKAEQIGMCLSYSIGLATGTFCGQNIGARKYDRVKKGLRIGCAIGFCYAAVVSVLVIVFARPFVGIFTQNAEVASVAVEVIYVTMAFGPVLGLVFIFQNFLKSAGDVAPTVWMSLMEIISRSVLAIVFAALLGRFGVWWATPVGWSASLLLGFMRYQSGAWKHKAVMK